MRKFIIGFIVFCLLSCVVMSEVAWAKTYQIGILPLRKPSEMLERFDALEKYLQRETELDIKLKLYPTTGYTGGYTAIVRDVANGTIDFAWLASVTCVQAHESGPVIPFVCAQNAGSPTYYGHLAVRVDAPYQSLEDLKGKKVAGTSASSTSGNLMPTSWLKGQGIDKFKYFGAFEYLGRHDNACQAVISGQFDACFVNEATFDSFNKEKVQLRSLWRHAAVPEFPMCVNTENVDAQILERIKAALLIMHEKAPEALEAVSVKYDKWVPIAWEDYLEIKKTVDTVHGQKFYDLDYWQAEADKEAMEKEA
ncbi:MAG: phosphate/phosphite/phosphonate ABC transporter substrate-binding protein, partial [Candidatus Omnitrophica bacterium]|nr:phosphate/phosphite/phosphonate ABC transporter substrate-binding protein [Candidatus Omnitrophota bacterium]